MSSPTAFAAPGTATDRRNLVLLGLIALLAARLLGLVLSQAELFFDEAQYWAWSRDLAFGYFSKPPLIAWIIRGATSVCGDGEACIRAAAPVLYSATSIVLYFVAREFYSETVALASALVFATLPGVSFSSTQMSTDVPLLFFYSLALLAWAKLLATRGMLWAAVLGVALGFGMLAKYAMAFFLLCATTHLAVSRQARRSLPPGGALLALSAAAFIVAPHALWNYRNGFVTVGHTAENAGWHGSFFHPGRFLEFFGSQFGVFGPILFAALLVIAWQSRRGATEERRRLLLSFSLPVLVLIGLQAVLSRAHANWAATAYPAAAVLVCATLLQGGWTRLFRISLGLHIAFAAMMVIAPAFAERIRLPFGIDAFSRQLGWHETAGLVRDELARQPYATILTEDRQVTAELLYYLHDTDVPLAAWLHSGAPEDHFEMTRPFTGSAGPVLLVTLRRDIGPLTARFSSSQLLHETALSSGPMKTRTVRFYRLETYDGADP